MCQAGFVPDFRLLRLWMVQWGAALRTVKAVCIFFCIRKRQGAGRDGLMTARLKRGENKKTPRGEH